MVYMHFPSSLTEEEVMLQAKYAKLKKKKKAVVALKAPKPEPEKVALAGAGARTQARDAREHARKLLKSGAIRAIATPPHKHHQLSFKRPRAARERKLSGPGSLDKAPASYQPFSAAHDSPHPASASPSPSASPSASPSPHQPHQPPSSSPHHPHISNPHSPSSPPRINSLYESFVTARDKEERVEIQKPKNSGNTVFVMGHKISEEYLRKHLGIHGTIVNISMELEKHRGFVTYDRPESAQRAIGELNGMKVGGIQLEVSLARRQPQLDRGEGSSSTAWSTLATSHSQKGPHKDGRSVVIYDDLFSN